MRLQFTLIGLLFLALSAQAQYSTPNTGVNWSLDSIALHSPTTVTVSGSTYTLLEELVIEEKDSLRIDSNIRLEIAGGIEVGVKGYFYCSADSIVITTTNQEDPYKGFWCFETAEVYFNHTRIEKGGGIKVITPNFLMENCEVSDNNLDRGSSTGSAISFSKGSPVVRNTIFKNNFHPALSSGANTSVAIQILNCYFEGNNQKNNNRPQINMGPSGDADTTRIIGNKIVGDRDLTVVGGVSVSSLIGVPNQFIIHSNDIYDNRYGFTSAGPSTGIIENNNIYDNNTETNPQVGGSGISLYNTGMVMISGNNIRNNLWGITLIEKAQANLGSDDPGDFNPGLNTFSDNGNGGQIYALYNNTANEVKALHNCWIEGQFSTIEEVENVIFHVKDDTTLGKVIYEPFECGQITSISERDPVSLKVYPNPTDATFSFAAEHTGILKIYNTAGVCLFTKKVNAGTNEINSLLAPGLYLVTFGDGLSFASQKLIIR